MTARIQSNIAPATREWSNQYPVPDLDQNDGNRRPRRLPQSLLVFGALFAAALAHAEDSGATAGGLPSVSPEAVGFSSERLQRLDSVMQRMVDQKEFAGIITVSARHGKIFHFKTYGKQDIASGSPMDRDAICRIYSMSKPITGVAMMILYEEGKWNPHDPISKYIPEFADLKVFKGRDSNGKMIMEDPSHPPTMGELMTHTAGFCNGAGDSPVDKLYHDEKGGNTPLKAGSLQEMIDRLAKIPLLCQPGTRWVYGVSADIQGYLIQKLSGKPLPEFERERIFDPLGMKDTGYYVPQEKRNRFATNYMINEKGELEVASDKKWGTYDKMPARPSGGGGLVSTASDYLRLAQALLNGGELNGARILGPETIRLMTANHLKEELMIDPGGSYNHRMRPGFGYGFGVGVYTAPAMADEPVGKGTYVWGGAADTWFWIDPTNDIVSIGMVQRVIPWTPILEELSKQLIYQALVRPDL